MDTARFSQAMRDVIGYSREEAHRLGSETIAPEHLLLGILRERDSNAMTHLAKFSIDFQLIKKKLETRSEHRSEHAASSTLQLDKKAERILKMMLLEARSLESRGIRSTLIDTEHLLLALLKEGDNLASTVLKEEGVEWHMLQDSIAGSFITPSSGPGFTEFNDDEDDDTMDHSGGQNNVQSQARATTTANNDTPALDNFGKDMTKAAFEGRLDPVVGRDNEILRVAQILSRRKKNNPVLIGEPGVGKSAIVEGLAIRIVQRKVSRVLFDKRLISLDLASMVAGTKYRGQFEERVKAILNELQNNKNIILFIDEIHTIVGAGNAAGSMDAANMLKPALARGDLQCIGATTLDEYRKSIEKDGALERRFQKIIVEPTTPEETLQILRNIKDRYEEHHHVQYTDEALEACVRLTQRYVSDRNFPDKAIDAMDEAGSRVHLSNIVVPDFIEILEKEIDDANLKKMEAVQSQNFELAASFRDLANTKSTELATLKADWEAGADIT